MAITISVSHTGISRQISVQANADGGKRITRVQTSYDGFPLADERPNGVTSFSNTYSRQEGISPGRDRVVDVTSTFNDGTNERAQKHFHD